MKRCTLEEMKNYKGRDDIPNDFDDFWNENIKEITIPKNYSLVKKDFGITRIDCYELRFPGVNGGSVYAKVVLPQSNDRIPVILSFHGYMGRASDWSTMFSYASAGFGFAMMDVPGQSGYSLDPGVTVRGNTVKGHIIRGALDGPNSLFYKSVYLDAYCFSQIIAGLDNVDEGSLYSYGASQGGALALVVAALNEKIKTVISIYPFLSDFRKVLEIGNTSEAYDELFRYFKFFDPFHETEDELMNTLAYIDVKNFAHRIKCPVKMITGLEDVVCYPITQFAIYNRLEAEKEHLLMPEYGHEDMHVYVNDTVFNWLCGTRIQRSFTF